MTKKHISEISKVPGWFAWVDREIFRFILEWQNKQAIKGDLLEVGCYMGKSAIVVGDGLKNDEKFTVVDLFENEASDELNAREMNDSYSTLTQEKFEKNYLEFHDALPEVVRGFSSETKRHVKNSSCRFIHIDGSHIYQHVVGDLNDSRNLAKKNGVVICDDYRSEHTPGVAASVWQSVPKGLKPICITRAKFYGTWGDPGPMQKAIEKWIETKPQLKKSKEKVNDLSFLRISYAENSDSKTQKELKYTKKQLEITKKQLDTRNNQLKTIRVSRTYRLAKKASRIYRKIHIK